jgi:hypothetical protein
LEKIMTQSLKKTIITLIVGIIAILVFIYLHFDHSGQTGHVRSVDTADQHREGIRVAGVQEPEEMMVEPLPLTIMTEPERMLKDARMSTDGIKDPVLQSALNRILEKYPDYSDGYATRVACLCSGSDRTAILSNVNSALKSLAAFHSRKN